MKPTQSCICQWLGNKKSGKVDVKLLPVACSPFPTFTRKLFQQALIIKFILNRVKSRLTVKQDFTLPEL